MINVHIRWMIRRDMPEILGIEPMCFDNPWTEDDFIRELRQRNCIGMVAEYQDSVCGHLIYCLHKSRIEVLKLAVAPGMQGMGIGRAMSDKLTSKLDENRRSSVEMIVRESNLDAQLFFKQCGWQAISVEKNWFPDTDEDGYEFEYSFISSAVKEFV